MEETAIKPCAKPEEGACQTLTGTDTGVARIPSAKAGGMICLQRYQKPPPLRAAPTGASTRGCGWHCLCPTAPPPPIQIVRIRKEATQKKSLGSTRPRGKADKFLRDDPGPPLPLPIPQTTYRNQNPPLQPRKPQKIENLIESTEPTCFSLFSANFSAN